MNEDRLTGNAKNLGGQVEEGLGQATGDIKGQLQGKARQAEGALQDVYGQVKETASDAAEAIRESATGANDFLRTTIEERLTITRREAVAAWLTHSLRRTSVSGLTRSRIDECIEERRESGHCK